MQRHKRWQSILIVAVLFLTVYNILPTVFFYSKPLQNRILAQRAEQITLKLAQRTNALEKESLDWMRSYCHLLNLKPVSIQWDEKKPQYTTVHFQNSKEAEKLKQNLDRAGSLIPFSPSSLCVLDSQDSGTTVLVQRRIPLHFDTKNLSHYFQFSTKFSEQGVPTPLYRALVEDRVIQLATLLGGDLSSASYVQAFLKNPSSAAGEDLALLLSQNILSFHTIFSDSPEITRRFYASFSQIDVANPAGFIEDFIKNLETIKNQTHEHRVALEKEKHESSSGLGQLHTALAKENTLTSALQIIRNNKSLFIQGSKPLDYVLAAQKIRESTHGALEIISLENKNPFIQQITIDWKADKILVQLYPDVQEKLSLFDSDINANEKKNSANQFVFSAIANLSRSSGEFITPSKGDFHIELSELNGSQSFLSLRLSTIAKAQIQQLQEKIGMVWHPSSLDLKSDVFPIADWDSFKSWPKQQQQLALVFFAPSTYSKLPPQGFKMSSLYVIAKGFDKMLDRYQKDPHSEEAKKFLKDFYHLQNLLMKNGFVGYSGKSSSISPEFSSDYIFEAQGYFQSLLGATREKFSVHGTKRYAVLEFTSEEQRILTENKIDTEIHENTLKARDDYYAAKLQIRGLYPTDVPKPIHSAFWSNCSLSIQKYFRGDDRKILNWGLDLSGGKTVQLELRDASNKAVKNESDLRQGINELYSRVNKMGVSEVSIRQEGNFIALDFPGSQSLSAAELVKASSMYFHVVHEKFSPSYTPLWQATNHFLQEVWDEAVISNRTSPEQVNLIAWKHLYGSDVSSPIPMSESGHILYDNGLRLANPLEDVQTSALDPSLCKLSLYRGSDSSEWFGQTHPLLIVFKNHALEGASLDNIHASYDPSKGNFLGFGVKGIQTLKNGLKLSPREDLHRWTARFAREKIVGTEQEVFSKGRGWRMAVILNGHVISAPVLESALRDQASITGSFTQREINQLESDLKAGSLSFSPYIISEKNVSPELGQQERMHGIIATLMALCLVIVVMISYYRFGGLIASIAVIINLLILWAVLVNIGATLTLASIAGLILTVGMAVDANVLVFERIREEYAETQNIAQAVQAGYKKAFSAIFDSNLTTIIAALILLNFDSGPIKGFAITLIIGIFSSMFTALFMTRFYFLNWIQNPKNTALNMASWIKTTSISFLKYAKITLWTSVVIIAVGGFLLIKNSHTIFGMDFRGGYALHLEMASDERGHYRETLEKALVKAGVHPQEMQLRELSPSHHVKLFLSRSLDQKDRPFYRMPQALSPDSVSYRYQTDPRLNWIVEHLQQNGVDLPETTLKSLDKNWTLVSGQMSDTMRNSALIGLSIALLCILIYITFRFEFHYALSATLCLAHDLIFTVGAIGILHALKVPIQIDLNTIAALMTIVGYSLNDTIIVFDRIREDLKIFKKMSFSDVIHQALNATLSRTLMTSGTTIIVLIPMIFLGGSTIFGFALVMAIGVFFGTLSSLFIAAPLMQYFAMKGQKRKEMAIENSMQS